MSILFITANLPPNISGAGIRALRTAKHIATKKEVFLVTRTKEPLTDLPYISILPEKNNKGFIVNNVFRNLLNVTILPLAIFSRIIKMEKPEIIHSFSISWLAIYIFFYNQLFWKAPFIIEITLMGGDTPNSQRKWWLFRKLSDYCLRKTDKINCISPLLFEHMLSLNYKSEQLKLIPNSFDERYRPASRKEKGELRGKYGYKKDDFLIVTVGGITHRKGYPLIAEIAVLLKELEKAKILAVGNYSSEYQQKLKATLQNILKIKGCDEKLQFMGYQDPLPYLQMSDLFLFASNREGFGSAIIEAMACKLPVVSKKIEKITDFIIEQNRMGVILDSNKPSDFFNAIKKLYLNRELASAIAEKGYKNVTNRFSLDRIISEYFHLYKSFNV